MKKLCTILLLCSAITASAQFGVNTPWTWIKGDNTYNQPSDYGVKGVTVSTNKPSAKSGAAVWTDASGNTYIYSGNSYADMWKYEPGTNNWTWMQGSNVQNTPAVYGTQGVANSNNTPGPRKGSAFWKDNNGIFWLYGGTNNPDDLWKYDSSLSTWTWVKGNATGSVSPVYTGPDQTPGSRIFSTTWVDATGNLWLFGGFSGSYKNDLWKYDISLNQWIYYSTASAPAVRSNATGWRSNSGELYLFGGMFSFENTTAFNDVWRYNTSANTWTQLKANQSSNYGTKGVASTTNHPKERFGTTGWKDNNGNFWMFGGTYPNPACSTACDYGTLEDLWKYDVALNEWTWMKGTANFNTPGDYGSLDITAASNKPGARTNAMSFSDNSGNFYLFGGSDTLAGYLNDLWKISGVALPLNLISFEGNKSDKDVLLHWQTANEVNTLYFNVQKSTNGNSFITIGKVDVAESSSQLKYYKYTDKFVRPGEDLFYRLEMVDKDGSRSYSSVIQVKNDRSFYAELQPNFASSEIRLYISDDRSEAVTILIRDVNGKLVKKEAVHSVSGSTSKIIDISHFSAGAYFLSIITSSEVRNLRFIKS